MDFLTQFKEKAAHVGGKMKETTQTVISDQQKNLDISRKKKEIKQLQEQLDDLYRLIGIRYITDIYDGSAEEASFQQELEGIQNLYQQQLNLQKSIDLESQDRKDCSCGEQVSTSHLFCPYCGKSLTKGA